MKFKINKIDFQNILSKIQGLTGRKSNLAITTSALIQSIPEGIKITATDLETGYEGFFPAEVTAEGSVAINSKKLLEIVREFPNENIVLHEVDNHWIEIGTKKVEYHIVGMDLNEFPTFPQIEDVPFFKINAKNLKDMIEKTIVISYSGDEKRAHIIGLYFEIVNTESEKMVRLVSTDGNRLSTADCRFDGKVRMPESSGYIVPKKGMGELSKFIDSEEDVDIGFKENHLVLKKNKETIVIRLLNGDYPQYRDILAHKESGNIIEFSKLDLLMMLRRMSILSSEDYKGVIFKFSHNGLVVNSTNPDIGESKEEMEIIYDGNLIEVAFNPRYFIEALNCVKDDQVYMNILDEEKPCFIEGKEDKNYLSVIMPMRI
ncbi:MAG: DNA polymerase III subunit beta [Desulfobacterales bacterium]